MKALKKIISLTAMSCTLIATCLYAGAANPHVHEYHVTGKNLVSVRPGYTHEYISDIKTDPVTGIATASGIQYLYGPPICISGYIFLYP